MHSETRNCQNCKKDFIIESEDFAFYTKIDVPAPTFCPQCRMQRRMMFRNERVLYRRACDLCKKNIISIHAPDKPYTVYCNQCYWSDAWDMSASAMEYDSSRSFFEQFRELQLRAPIQSLIVNYTTLVNSDYVNHTGGAKNCYYLFDSDYNENCLYGSTVYHIAR